MLVKTEKRGREMRKNIPGNFFRSFGLPCQALDHLISLINLRLVDLAIVDLTVVVAATCLAPFGGFIRVRFSPFAGLLHFDCPGSFVVWFGFARPCVASHG